MLYTRKAWEDKHNAPDASTLGRKPCGVVATNGIGNCPPHALVSYGTRVARSHTLTFVLERTRAVGRTSNK